MSPQRRPSKPTASPAVARCAEWRKRIDYITDEAHGNNWTLMLGDSSRTSWFRRCRSVDLLAAIHDLLTYSPSVRDLGNSDTRQSFLEHYGFIIEQLQVTNWTTCMYPRPAVDDYQGDQ